jgi:CMP-2-keto-3-deoxyoctulosonic acid synthetase
MTSTAILIPARYNSTRLPGKPLVKLGGIPMIQRVFNVCWNAGFATYVLTDDNRIADLIPKNNCYIDVEDYDNGTERCAGAIASRKFDDYDQFINVQGDMPDVTTDMLLQAVLLLNSYDVGTVYTDMPKEQQDDPSTVKLVRAGNSALWFGRGMTGYGDWHLGVYSYTKEALLAYPHLQIPKEEHVEKLEQLRWLKNGWQMGCTSTHFNGVEINTEHDVNLWNYKNVKKIY